MGIIIEQLCADLRTLRQQLADKERELAEARKENEKAYRKVDEAEYRLAAANAVVDEARKLDELGGE